MTSVEFATAFRAVYGRASARYALGGATAANLLNAADVAFLASQGITAQHVFDYVEDLANYGAPDFPTAHAIELVRRDYFLNEQKGHPSTVVDAFAALGLPRNDAGVEAALAAQLDHGPHGEPSAG